MEDLQWDMFDTPFGSMLATADDSGLRLLMRYNSRTARHVPSGNRSRTPAAFKELRSQLEQYFTGKLKVFNLPLCPTGTEFQQSVWQAVQAVPWGSTVSYLDIAKRIGNPAANRAVGHANGRNPIHIIIPCHRVIGMDGSLRGYAGGLDMKRSLLELEGHEFGSRQVELFD